MKPCPVCKKTNCSSFLEINSVPAHCNLLWPSKEKAISCPKGDIQLSYCNNCTHVFNDVFNPNMMDYSEQYEASLHHSPVFQDFAKTLAQRLIENHNIRNKKVMEIGCGKGDFLELLCEMGDNQGIGFDPSFEPREHSDKVNFVQEHYSDKYGKADLLVSRHVLEHVADPVDFLKKHSSAVGLESIVYFEVPNSLHTLKGNGIWDIIYEHCSYFSPGSLSYLFASSGFSIIQLEEAYHGQFLGIEATKGSTIKTVPDLSRYVNSFSNNYKDKVDFWNNKLKDDCVVWGAGSKGVMFLNTVENNVEYVVDINPNKQGNYIAGTGQKIIAPEFLREINPLTVVIMNPVYKNEVEKTLSDLGVDSTVICA